MTLTNKLETLVDKEGLNNVLESLAIVCFEKAEHIQSNYGNGDAKLWEKAGDIIYRAADKVPID